jgi:hypothetical protein
MLASFPRDGCGPHCPPAPDFDPAVVDEVAAAGIYVCPTMNVHALNVARACRRCAGKVIMGLYSGGARIVAGTDAGIDE